MPVSLADAIQLAHQGKQGPGAAGPPYAPLLATQTMRSTLLGIINANKSGPTPNYVQPNEAHATPDTCRVEAGHQTPP